jgi:hypothetical protein
MHDHDSADDQWLPAAGVPWFVTIFGRDSLIVSLQNMIVNTGLARGALKKLGQFQAQAMDDYRDAEPGKILHELRFGELAHFHRVPHTPYYGTADATPLYLILLHEKSAAQARISIISGRNRKQRRTRWRSEVNSNCRYRFVEQLRQRQVSFATSGRTAKRYRPASSNSPRSANESQIWAFSLDDRRKRAYGQARLFGTASAVDHSQLCAQLARVGILGLRNTPQRLRQRKI